MKIAHFVNAAFPPSQVKLGKEEKREKGEGGKSAPIRVIRVLFPATLCELGVSARILPLMPIDYRLHFLGPPLPQQINPVNLVYPVKKTGFDWIYLIIRIY